MSKRKACSYWKIEYIRFNFGPSSESLFDFHPRIYVDFPFCVCKSFWLFSSLHREWIEYDIKPINELKRKITIDFIYTLSLFRETFYWDKMGQWSVTLSPFRVGEWYFRTLCGWCLVHIYSRRTINLCVEFWYHIVLKFNHSVDCRPEKTYKMGSLVDALALTSI